MEISQLVSTLFETNSFTPRNKVFHCLKRSVSHRETNSFTRRNDFETNCFQVKKQ